ncbi:MAG: NAD(P)/FAD-dependent oxidoreductase [Gomphosphaeria aponina SAG 52.96 = DSM 107014]|uniref:NAD(P)/FAD-dependent oxidoreductase n=1 Tax=Gomphosphaeria aponina SAG 52.96 = DSM 107014 TaxID=1521640 RepID=A0A941GPB6_9CHRO|nr:NAD(P)/FAD-dependent oxidoreductase [Gomphosphaeria aponina SAG 52.96 = DSM 107014]
MGQNLQVIVIGGGAAGFFGAIACANTNTDVRVTLIEAGRKLLTKVLISGGGRCNVTHHCFDAAQLVQHYPRGGKALRGAFTRFQPQDTVNWFESRGVKLKTEADGRMFPVTDNSQTIADCLLDTANQAGVKILTGSPVVAVRKFNLSAPNLKGGFEVELKTGEVIKGDRLLLASGSNPTGYRIAKSLGHQIEPPVPSLFTFNIRDPRLQNLAGVSVENAHIRLITPGKIKLEQTGPLLITHWGLSGPGVLKLSAWGARILAENNYQMSLLINWVVGYNLPTLNQDLLEVKSAKGKKRVLSYSPLALPRRLWQNLVSFVGINPETTWGELSKKGLNKLVEELTQGRYQIEGKGVFKEEFVTCGGVTLKEVDFKTMESKICPGLFFAGEILDIDGVTGGFNFQSAWTTSWLAGQGMIKEGFTIHPK